MACSFDREQLSALLDGQLDPRSKAQVQAHVDQCVECRKEMEMARSASEAVRALPKVKPPAWLAEQIQRQVSTPKPEASIIKYRKHLQVALACAAGVLLALTVVHFAGPETATTTSPASVGRVNPELEQRSTVSPQPKAPSSNSLDERNRKFDSERPVADRGAKKSDAKNPEPSRSADPEKKAEFANKEKLRNDEGLNRAEHETESAPTVAPKEHLMVVYAEDAEQARKLIEAEVRRCGAEASSKDKVVDAYLSETEAKQVVARLTEQHGAGCEELPVLKELGLLQEQSWKAKKSAPKLESENKPPAAKTPPPESKLDTKSEAIKEKKVASDDLHDMAKESPTDEKRYDADKPQARGQDSLGKSDAPQKQAQDSIEKNGGGGSGGGDSATGAKSNRRNLQLSRYRFCIMPKEAQTQVESLKKLADPKPVEKAAEK